MSTVPKTTAGLQAQEREREKRKTILLARATWLASWLLLLAGALTIVTYWSLFVQSAAGFP